MMITIWVTFTVLMILTFLAALYGRPILTDASGRGIRPTFKKMKSGTLFFLLILLLNSPKFLTFSNQLSSEYAFVGSVAAGIYFIGFILSGLLIRWYCQKNSSKNFLEALQKTLGKKAGYFILGVILIRSVHEIAVHINLIAGLLNSHVSWLYLVTAFLFFLLQFFYFQRQGRLPLKFFILAQTLLLVMTLYIVSVKVLPSTFFYNLFHAGQFSLKYGLDVIYLAVIQGVSYGLLHPLWFFFDFESIEERGIKIPVAASLVSLIGVLYSAFIGVYTYQKSFPHMLTAVSSVLLSFPGLLGILAFTAMTVSVIYMVNLFLGIARQSLAQAEEPQTGWGPWLLAALSLWILVFSTHLVNAVLFIAIWSIGFIPYLVMNSSHPKAGRGLKYNLILGFFVAAVDLFNLLPQSLVIGGGAYGESLTLTLFMLILSFIIQKLAERA